MYYPQTTAKPLEFGIAFHRAAEHWYNPDTWGIDDESREIETLQVFRLECLRQKNEFLRSPASQINAYSQLDPDAEVDYNERIELGQGMLRSMFKTSYDIDADYRPVGVEVPFEVPILDPDGNQIWCKCDRCFTKHSAWVLAKPDKPVEVDERFLDKVREWWPGLPVTLGGRIDALFQDQYGRYWIVDWKTAAKLSTGDPGSPDDFLLLDDQITSYCWALWILKLDVAGFIYHEFKKTIQEEPEPLKRARLGAMYSQNKSKDYDYQVYLTTVMENDRVAYDSGVYDNFLAHLEANSSGPYKRHVIHRNVVELEQAGVNLAYEALDMTDVNLRVYPNPGRFGCNTCAFREPCLGKNRGEDYLYTLDSLFDKRTRMYYEDALPNTDKPSVG